MLNHATLADATICDRTHPGAKDSSPRSVLAISGTNDAPTAVEPAVRLRWTRHLPTEGKGSCISSGTVRRGQPGNTWALLDGERVVELPAASLAQLWSLRLDVLRRLVEDAGGVGSPLEEVEVLAPIDGRTEVWAAGVTYEISREARVEESERAADCVRARLRR